MLELLLSRWRSLRAGLAKPPIVPGHPYPPTRLPNDPGTLHQSRAPILPDHSRLPASPDAFQAWCELPGCWMLPVAASTPSRSQYAASFRAVPGCSPHAHIRLRSHTELPGSDDGSAIQPPPAEFAVA